MAFSDLQMQILKAHAEKFMDPANLWFILRKTTTRGAGGITPEIYNSVGSAKACSMALERRIPYESTQADQVVSTKIITTEFPVGSDIIETDLLTTGMTRIVGAYNSATAYTAGDGVIVSGGGKYPTVYIALTANTGVDPVPNSSRSTWKRAILDEVTTTDRERTQIPCLTVNTVQRV